MSEIFIIKDTGKGVINELSPEKIVPIQSPQGEGTTGDLQAVLEAGSTATLSDKDLHIDMQNFKITPDGTLSVTPDAGIKSVIYGNILQLYSGTIYFQSNDATFTMGYDEGIDLRVASNKLTINNEVGIYLNKNAHTIAINDTQNIYINSNSNTLSLNNDRFHIESSGGRMITMDDIGGNQVISINNQNKSIVLDGLYSAVRAGDYGIDIQANPGNNKYPRWVGVDDSINIISETASFSANSTGYTFSTNFQTGVDLTSYTLPPVRGTEGQTLVTDNEGIVTWKDTIPTPPTTGDYVLKSANGVMSWVPSV